MFWWLSGKCREGHARGAGLTHVRNQFFVVVVVVVCVCVCVCVCVVVVFGLYFFFGVRHKSLRSILKNQIPSRISIKT